MFSRSGQQTDQGYTCVNFLGQADQMGSNADSQGDYFGTHPIQRALPAVTQHTAAACVQTWLACRRRRIRPQDPDG